MTKGEKNGKKVDLDSVDLDKMEELTTENPGLIEYAHTLGSALVKPEDQGKIKARAVAAMHEQTDMQVKQIFDQMKLLANQANEIKKRVEVSERIYRSKMSFEPLIGKTYYLYEREDDTDLLSLIAPSEWGRSKSFSKFVAEVKLLADHTWEVKSEE